LGDYKNTQGPDSRIQWRALRAEGGLGGTNSPLQAAVGQRTRYPPMGIEMTVGIHAPGPWRGPGAGHGIWSVRGRGLLRRRSVRVGTDPEKPGEEGRKWGGEWRGKDMGGIQTHSRPQRGAETGGAGNPNAPAPEPKVRRGTWSGPKPGPPRAAGSSEEGCTGGNNAGFWGASAEGEGLLGGGI